MPDSSSDIALLVTSLGTGGTERYVRDLAVALASRGMRVTVIVDSEPLIRREALLRANVAVEFLGISEPFSPGLYSHRLTNALLKFRPRILHVNAWMRPFEILQTASKVRIPAIVTRHCTDRKPRLRDLIGLNRYPFGLYRERARARRYPAPVISISKISQANLKTRWNGAVRTSVVYNGIAPPQCSCDWDRPPERPTIAWVGSMIPRKDPALALRVFGQVALRMPDARLLMLGDGPLRPSIAHAAKSIQGDVSFPGYSDSVLSTLAGSTVYLQTSTDEGIAYSVLEAMSVGLPVVATNAGATSEAVIDGRTGFLTKHNDMDALAERVLRLAASPALRKELGINALNRFQETFTLDRMVRDTLHVYETLCGVRFPVAAAMTERGT